MRNPKYILPVLATLTVLFFAAMFYIKRDGRPQTTNVGCLEAVSGSLLSI